MRTLYFMLGGTIVTILVFYCYIYPIAIVALEYIFSIPEIPAHDI